MVLDYAIGLLRTNLAFRLSQATGQDRSADFAGLLALSRDQRIASDRAAESLEEAIRILEAAPSPSTP